MLKKIFRHKIVLVIFSGILGWLGHQLYIDQAGFFIASKPSSTYDKSTGNVNRGGNGGSSDSLGNSKNSASLNFRHNTNIKSNTYDATPLKHTLDTLMAQPSPAALMEFLDELSTGPAEPFDFAVAHFKNTLVFWVEHDKQQQAAVYAEAFLELYYNDVDVLTLAADAYMQADRLLPAIKANYALKLHLDSLEAQQQTSQIIHDLVRGYHKQLEQRQDWHALLGLYDYLIGMEPEYPQYFLSQAKLYLQLEDYANANHSLAYIIHDPVLGPEAERLAYIANRALAGYAQIPLTQSGSSYLVSINLDDRYDMNLLIDTGASISAMSYDLFQAVRRKSQPDFNGKYRLSTANGTIEAPSYRFKQITLGNQTLYDVEFVVIDNLAAADGLLGMNILSQFEFEIDQKEKILLLNPQAF